MPPENSTAERLETNVSKLYDCLNAKSAPAVVGKPIFEKDLEIVKMTGARDWTMLFGAKDQPDNAPFKNCINFGSRRDCGLLPDDTRLRLFGLKKLINAVEVQAQIMTRQFSPSAAAMMATPIYKHMLEPMLKAFNITDFSTFIDTVNTRFFFEEFEIPLLVGDLFDQMPMESASINVPGILGRLYGKLESDAATFVAQSNTQANYNVNSKNNVVHTQITEDLNQDSAPAVIEKLRREVMFGIARSEDRSYLNGDVSVAHQDADVTAATDFRKGYNGLRKIAFDNSAAGVIYDHGGDAPSKVLFASLLHKMGRFASEKSDLAWIMGPTIGNMLVTGAIPELFTAFAFGGPASNVTGQVPPVFGIKPVESEYMREDLAATGVYTAPGATKTSLILVKKSRFQRWLRQAVRVWAAPALPSSDIMLMSAKKRHSFAGVPQSADEKAIAMAINVETAS